MNVYKQYLEIKSLQEINIPISNEKKDLGRI